MIDLKSLRRVERDYPPRVLIYGPEGIGKNTLANEFPHGLTFDWERGAPNGTAVLQDEVDSYDGTIAAIEQLIMEDHEVKTVIFDSLDKLQLMIFQKVCEDQNPPWPNIETPGYGKGYAAALPLWDNFMSAVEYMNRTRGICPIFIGHSGVDRFDDPTTASYNRYDMRLQKLANALMKDRCDIIAFINYLPTIKEEKEGFNKKTTKAGGGNDRWVMFEGMPAFAAKNRFDMPPKVKYEIGKGFDMFAKFIPGFESDLPNKVAGGSEPEPEPEVEKEKAKTTKKKPAKEDA